MQNVLKYKTNFQFRCYLQQKYEKSQNGNRNIIKVLRLFNLLKTGAFKINYKAFIAFNLKKKKSKQTYLVFVCYFYKI